MHRARETKDTSAFSGSYVANLHYKNALRRTTRSGTISTSRTNFVVTFSSSIFFMFVYVARGGFISRGTARKLVPLFET